MKYRKKPVVIDAVRVPLSLTEDWVIEAHASGFLWPLQDGSVRVKTNHGATLAKAGDWIIRQTTGEVYPCAPDIFAASYEPAE